ncbi:titin [Nephila pilipes]|uniref:Titin n=1 Tax=Nephila pilipes TaxID=299642 RepID=A0A8X6PV55_NEPPI|nr:titin [Nephila pilipes]
MNRQQIIFISTAIAAIYLAMIKGLYSHEAPIIQPFSLPERIQIGRSLSLTCAVMSGTPPLNFKWYKNQKLLQTENIKSSNKKVSFLTIDPIVESSEGNYSCIVSNSNGQTQFSAVLVVTAPPIWITEPENEEIVENGRLNLKCIANGSPNPRITWKKFDNSQNGEISTILNLKSENGSLILDPILKIHEGSYMCIADNGAGNPLKKTVTIVVREFPEIQPFQFPQYIQIGYKTSVICTVMKGGSPLSFIWYKNGRILKESPNINVESNEKFSTLHLDPIEDTSIGNYTCVVSNPFGKDNHTAFLSVKAPPTWMKEPEDAESIEGENINIHCIASGSPSPNIRMWKLDDTEMKYSHRSMNGSLDFKPIQKFHEGKYACEADNGVGSSLKKIFSLIVYDTPKIQPFQFPSQIKRGDTASITCAIMRGSQPVKFTWIKDGKPLENRLTANIISNEDLSSLIIKSVDENSVGNYTCIASSSFGNDNFTAILKVKVPPSWIKEPQDVETIEGQNAKFSCLARGSPNPSFEWRKIGKENIHLPKFGQGNSNGTLIFNPALKDDDGSYECRVRNGIGESLSKVVLLIVHDEITANDGAASVSSSNQTASTANLFLHPVLKAHCRKYVCKAENGFGTPLRKIIFVLIYGMRNLCSKDKIQPFNFPQKIREGESTKVMCTVNAEDKTFTFKWLKDGIHIRNSNRVEISVLTDYSLLKIKSVSTQDSGNYTCIASSQQNTLNYTTTLLVEAPVQWTIEPADQEVILGEEVKFFCSARGFPTPIIKWNKAIGEQEYQVETSNRFRVDIEGTLIISNVQSEDGAIYICYARNGVGNSLQKKVSLSVIEKLTFHAKSCYYLKYFNREFSRIELILDMLYAIIILTAFWIQVICNDAPEIHPFHPPAKLKIGDSANIFCSVTRGQVPLSFKWYKNGQLLENHSKEVHNDEKFSALVINSVTATSAGNYTCVVSNSFGKNSYSTLLVVRSPPYWIKEPEDVEIVEGNSLTLFCNAGGTPQPKIIWRKKGETQNKDYFKYVTGSDNNGSLLLHPAMKEHEGIYTCEVNNDVGETLKKQATVIVHDAPKIIPFHFPTMIEIQKKASVACILEQGGTPLQFKWLKDKYQLHETKNIKIKTLDDVSIITIDPVTSNNSGNYSCLVSNSFGKDSYTSQLIVEGK